VIQPAQWESQIRCHEIQWCYKQQILKGPWEVKQSDKELLDNDLPLPLPIVSDLLLKVFFLQIHDGLQVNIASLTSLAVILMTLLLFRHILGLFRYLIVLEVLVTVDILPDGPETGED